jgi:hypothetical protein
MGIDAMDKKSDFHIVVGAGDIEGVTTQDQVKYEMGLLKAALLYADRVTLVSLTTACIAPIFAMTTLSRRDTVRLIEKCLPHFIKIVEEPDLFRFTVRMHKRLATKSGSLSKRQAAKLAELDHLARYMLEGAQEDLKARLPDYQLEHYETAIKTGLVELATSGPGTFDVSASILCRFLNTNQKISSQRSDLTDLLATEFICSLALAVQSNSYMLFDRRIGEGLGFFALGPRESLSPAQLKRSKHIAFAKDVMQRLPLLENASFNEIIDIRNEYANPLIRFRASIIGFAEKIQSTPWDEDFALEAEDLFRSEVEPKVVDIEEQMKSNKFIRELLNKAKGADLSVSSGSGLGLILSSLYFLPDIVSKVLGTGIGASFLVSDSYKSWKEKQREINTNQMVFYYQAGRRLAERARQK